jgi:hypothetical protein
VAHEATGSRPTSVSQAGGDPIVQTNSGRWHNNYDTDAGRAALKFYIDVVHKLSFAKTVPGSLDGGPESSDKLEVRETGMRPGVSAFSGRWPCPVGDEILGTESEPEGRKERGRWAGGGEDRPVLDYAARRTYR